MARCRVNVTAVCSSRNYRQSKKLHKDYLKRNHEMFMEMVVKEEIILRKRAYIKCFGELIAITPDEAIKLKETVTIIYK